MNVIVVITKIEINKSATIRIAVVPTIILPFESGFFAFIFKNLVWNL